MAKKPNLIVILIDLVSPDGFSARYDLDRVTGRISRESHALYGASIAGKVLVCPLAKGGFATSWALFDLRSRGLAPVAMLFTWANPVMVQGRRSWPASPSWTSCHPTRWRRSGRGTGSGWIRRRARGSHQERSVMGLDGEVFTEV